MPYRALGVQAPLAHTPTPAPRVGPRLLSRPSHPSHPGRVPGGGPAGPGAVLPELEAAHGDRGAQEVPGCSEWVGGVLRMAKSDGRGTHEGAGACRGGFQERRELSGRTCVPAIGEVCMGRGRLGWAPGASPRESGLHSASQLSLEEPVEEAILLSLVGVKSILANQWPTLLQDNALRVSVLWESAWAPGTRVCPAPLQQGCQGVHACLRGRFSPRSVGRREAGWRNGAPPSEDDWRGGREPRWGGRPAPRSLQHPLQPLPVGHVHPTALRGQVSPLLCGDLGLPTLTRSREGGGLVLAWKLPASLPCPAPHGGSDGPQHHGAPEPRGRASRSSDS